MRVNSYEGISFADALIWNLNELLCGKNSSFGCENAKTAIIEDKRVFKLKSSFSPIFSLRAVNYGRFQDSGRWAINRLLTAFALSMISNESPMNLSESRSHQRHWDGHNQHCVIHFIIGQLQVYGTKCETCGESIADHEGIDHGTDSWHKSCFTCGRCNKNLSTHKAPKLKWHEKKPYCTRCYIISFPMERLQDAAWLHDNPCYY